MRALRIEPESVILDGAAGPALYLRLPPLDAPDALAALAAAAAARPHGFALAGAAGGADVQRLGARLAVEEARLGLPDGAFRILAFADRDAAGGVGAVELSRGFGAAGGAGRRRRPARRGAGRVARPARRGAAAAGARPHS